MRKRPLPSISSLQSFEAVARHLSTTRAAEELHLTQSAVSKQVARLEDILQNLLFTRTRKRLQLTQAGELYLSEVRKILNQVQMSSHYIQSYGGDTEVLAVVAPPTFAAVWLIPRLVGFGRAYPNIHLNIRAESGALESTHEKADIEIYFGIGARPSFECLYLFDESVVAVCAPALLEGGMPPSLQQLTELRLLQFNSRPEAWHDWFEAQGWHSKSSYHGPRFETFHMLISAAKSGCGVALVPRFLIEEELQDGKLSIAWDYVHGTKGGYYLAYTERTASVPKVRALIQWVRDQVSAN